jgi:NADPH:quinone reductase-like Zn-dependent oxidoreductase
LYESALQYVGWPIVPGFDVAGTVEHVINQQESMSLSSGSSSSFVVGDQVFGCALFGAYSTNIMVPSRQLRRIPANCTMAQAAALPAVSLTALYALYLAGHFPIKPDLKYQNRSILIHSAAGGVGSMLVQMSRILGLHPIVGVVGTSSKVEEATRLGCHVVINKSSQPLWEVASKTAPQGYATIMDANGVSTLQQSYQHLATTGRLIVFGFHSNLPMGKSMLSPMEWIRMAFKMTFMIRFDPMDLVISNKAVLGFNLSFLFEEIDLVSQLFDQIFNWLEEGKLQCPCVVELNGMDQITLAHDMIQSGKSIGKIVIRTKI